MRVIYIRFNLLAFLAFPFLVLTVLVSGQVRAQTAPGQIEGTVMDGETGELLDYANVLLKGTARGTMSLGGGKFYFSGTPSGTYTVQVLYLGYAPLEKTVTLGPGDEVDLMFSLETVIVEQLQAFDIEGDAYMVNIKESVTQHDVDGETFEKYAIDSVEDALAKQAGVILRANELHVRGGRAGEISFQIDGVRVDNPLGSGAMEVSGLSIESMGIATGGLDAKYGNALSGVVNFTTKEGGEKFSGGIRFLTDDFGRQDKTYTNYDRFEYSFGGPTPVNGLTYNLSGDLSFTDTERTSIAHRPEYKIKVLDTTLFKFRRRQFNNAKGSIKLAQTLNERMKVTAEYSYTTSLAEQFLLNWNVEGYSKRVLFMPEIRYLSEQGVWFYAGGTVPVYYGDWYENMLSTARTAIVVDERNASFHRVPMPILEVRSAADNTIHTVVAHAEFDGFRYPYSEFSTVAKDSAYTYFNSADHLLQRRSIAQVGKVVWRHNLSQATFYNIRLGLVAFDYRSDVQGKDPWEYVHGGIWSPALFTGQDRIYLQGTDYYTDPLSPYFVTTSDWPTYMEEYSRVYSLGFELVSNRWDSHLIETGFTVNYNDLERYSLAAPAVMRQSRNTLEYSQGGNQNIFHTYNPEASWYLQDRWEYEGMVVNGGLRWDMFSPGTSAAILVDNDFIDTNVTKYKTAFQPRLGFAFPITERDGFHFHYGRFVQFPDREHLFASQDPVGSSETLGNPNLEPMTTVQYQAGVQHQFNDYIAGQFSLYSRDIFDLIASNSVTDESSGQQLRRFINKAYASSRGIELTLNKRFSNHYEYRISYSYAFADGVASDTAFGSNPQGMAYLPNQELPLDWDQRHTLDVQMRLAEPGVWSSSFSFTFGSGFPWTPFDRYARKQDPMLENSERLPATYSLDIQFQRDIDFYGNRLSLQLQGLNLLNQDQVVTETGVPIYPPMINGAAFGRGYATETGKYGAALLYDEDGDGDDEYIPIYDPNAFGPHRIFRMGIGYYF